MWSPNPESIITSAMKVAQAQAALVEQFKSAIQDHIDATAAARNYTDGVSLASYVASTVPSWAAEAAAFVAWRDAVWAYAYAEMDRVLNAERPQPSVAEMLSELPAIEWPEPA